MLGSASFHEGRAVSFVSADIEVGPTANPRWEDYPPPMDAGPSTPPAAHEGLTASRQRGSAGRAHLVEAVLLEDVHDLAV